MLPGDRSRHAILTATLVAGVAVVGVSAAATADQDQAAAHRSALTSPISPDPGSYPDGARSDSSATAADPGGVESVFIPPLEDTSGTGADLSWESPARKVRPKPKPQPAGTITALWVDPLPEARVTSCFGERWGRLHAGVDLAATDGTRIRAAGAGVVVAAGEAEGYGNAVLIDHGNGYLTHYGHLSVITVHPGDHVKAGDQLGNEGSTGHSTGPHLHFEVHQGYYQNPVEPTAWLQARGVHIPGCVP